MFSMYATQLREEVQKHGICLLIDKTNSEDLVIALGNLFNAQIRRPEAAQASATAVPNHNYTRGPRRRVYPLEEGQLITGFNFKSSTRGIRLKTLSSRKAIGSLLSPRLNLFISSPKVTNA